MAAALALPTATTEDPVRRKLLVDSTVFMAGAGVLWGTCYYGLGARQAALVPWIFSVLSFLSLAIPELRQRYEFLRSSQLWLRLLLPFFLAVVLGGTAASSAVILWSATSPLSALVLSPKRSAGWFFGFVAVIVASVIAETVLPFSVELPSLAVSLFFILNLCAPALMVFLLLRQFIVERKRAHIALEEALRLQRETHDDLVQTQQQLVQSEKLASLGALTSGIAHEIKNPLNFINNFAGLSVDLADELEEELEAELGRAADGEVRSILDDLKANAAKIERHGKRADSIVQNMMAHARKGSGAQRAVDLNALVQEYADLAYQAKNVQTPTLAAALEHNYADTAGTVEVVPEEIGRVVVNLVSNALDAVEERGAGTVTVSTQRNDDEVSIQVIDTGPGIPEDERDKIFEPFFTTKPTGSGTGLGLSMSYDIVTSGHRGNLRIESTEGEGTIATVTLPAPRDLPVTATRTETEAL